MTDTVGPVEAKRGEAESLIVELQADFNKRWPVNPPLIYSEFYDRARKIDAQMAALTEALEAVERWFTPRRELVEPYEELLAIVREALRSVKEAQQ